MMAAAFEASNPALGEVTCFICGNAKATLHRARGRAKHLYWRCYAPDGAMICGTLQPQGPVGQKALEQARGVAKPDDAVVGDGAPDGGESPPKQKRSGGIFSALLGDDDE